MSSGQQADDVREVRDNDSPKESRPDVAKERAARLRALDRKIGRWEKEVGGSRQPNAVKGRSGAKRVEAEPRAANAERALAERLREVEARAEISERKLTERLVKIEARLQALDEFHSTEVEARLAETQQRVLDEIEQRAAQEGERLTKSTEARLAKRASELESRADRRAEEAERRFREAALETARATGEERPAGSERRLTEGEKQLREGQRSKRQEAVRRLDAEIEKRAKAADKRLAETRQRQSGELEAQTAKAAERGMEPDRETAPKVGRRRKRRKAGAPPRTRQVGLNQASFERLRELGLSITQANRLVRLRDARGGFSSMDELDELPGFPKDQLDDLKQCASLETDPAARD
jgi:DNA uptake protein ComE-like DNA-binding protein